MMMVDRIEGERAVVEFGGELHDIPLACLPEGTREGDRLSFTNLGRDTAEAEARLARLRAKTPQGPGTIDL